VGTLGLSTITTALEGALRDAPQLEGVHVSQELDDPTADQCPAVIIRVGPLRWEERHLAARDPDSGTAFITMTFGLQCVEFSAQSIEDARTLRDALLDNAIAVLKRNRQVGGVLDLRITGIEPVPGPPSDGIFSAAIINLEAEKFV